MISGFGTLLLFNFEFAVSRRESTKKNFKLDLVYEKRSKIKMKMKKRKVII